MKFFAISFSLLLLSLTACKETVRTPGGEIPSEYIEEAQNFMGTFEGHMEGQPAKMNLSLIGNKAKLDISVGGKEFSMAECYVKKGKGPQVSRIGQLKSLLVDDNSSLPVHEIRFSLDHNCNNIEGRTVELWPSYDLKTYNVYITERVWMSDWCIGDEYKYRPASKSDFLNSIRANHHIPNHPFETPDQVCYQYIKGSFTRN